MGSLLKVHGLVGNPDVGLPSTTRDGVPIPPEDNPAELYKRLFVQGTPADVAARIDNQAKGGSILDAVLDDGWTAEPVTTGGAATEADTPQTAGEVR